MNQKENMKKKNKKLVLEMYAISRLNLKQKEKSELNWLKRKATNKKMKLYKKMKKFINSREGPEREKNLIGLSQKKYKVKSLLNKITFGLQSKIHAISKTKSVKINKRK